MSGLSTVLRTSARWTVSRLAVARFSSDAPQRFGTAKGHSGWTWDNNGVGMGGKDAGPGTEIKEGLGKGKEYELPEYFKNDLYSYYDLEKQLVDSKKRLEQPESGLTDFW